jgi:hypothetical protein
MKQNSDGYQREPNYGSLFALRRISLVVTCVGGVGSLFLFNLARQEPPLLIVVLFTIWVISPFLALVLCNLRSTRWSSPARLTLYIVSLIVSAVSLIVYTRDVMWPPATTPAFVWVLIPPLTGGLAVLSVTTAALVSHRAGSE